MKWKIVVLASPARHGTEWWSWWWSCELFADVTVQKLKTKVSSCYHCINLYEWRKHTKTNSSPNPCQWPLQVYYGPQYNSAGCDKHTDSFVTRQPVHRLDISNWKLKADGVFKLERVNPLGSMNVLNNLLPIIFGWFMDCQIKAEKYLMVAGDQRSGVSKTLGFILCILHFSWQSSLDQSLGQMDWLADRHSHS